MTRGSRHTNASRRKISQGLRRYNARRIIIEMPDQYQVDEPLRQHLQFYAHTIAEASKTTVPRVLTEAEIEALVAQQELLMEGVGR